MKLESNHLWILNIQSDKTTKLGGWVLIIICEILIKTNSILYFVFCDQNYSVQLLSCKFLMEIAHENLIKGTKRIVQPFGKIALFGTVSWGTLQYPTSNLTSSWKLNQSSLRDACPPKRMNFDHIFRSTNFGNKCSIVSWNDSAGGMGGQRPFVVFPKILIGRIQSSLTKVTQIVALWQDEK